MNCVNNYVHSKQNFNDKARIRDYTYLLGVTLARPEQPQVCGFLKSGGKRGLLFYYPQQIFIKP